MNTIYYSSSHSQVYCNSHVPKSGPGHFDQTSVGIRQALNAPKSKNIVNEQIRGNSREIESKYHETRTFVHELLTMRPSYTMTEVQF